MIPRTVPSIRAAFLAAVVLPICLLQLMTLGCTGSAAISSRAVDYNVAAESARNEMLLLNVLRARDRRPMIFTGLARISGSIRTQGSIGAAGAAGPGASDIRTLNTGVSYSDAPSFDVAVLDSQEFTRGIMTPLNFDLVEYFWDQGFSRDVLFYLAVERIEIDCPGGAAGASRLHELINERGEESFADFEALLDDVDARGHWEVDPHQTEPIGPPIADAEVRRLSSLIQVAGSGLQLDPQDDGTWRLERPSKALVLVVPTVDPCGSRSGGGAVDLHLYDSKSALARARRRSPAELKGRAVLRSPQSIVFFLGEQTRPGRQVLIRERYSGQPEEERRIFVVQEASDCARAIVRVAYTDGRYVIPEGNGRCHPGRSMQSLALTAQLLALQQSAKDLPAGGTLRLVGQ